MTTDDSLPDGQLAPLLAILLESWALAAAHDVSAWTQADVARCFPLSQHLEDRLLYNRRNRAFLLEIAKLALTLTDKLSVSREWMARPWLQTCKLMSSCFVDAWAALRAKVVS